MFQVSFSNVTEKPLLFEMPWNEILRLGPICKQNTSRRGHKRGGNIRTLSCRLDVPSSFFIIKVSTICYRCHFKHLIKKQKLQVRVFILKSLKETFAFALKVEKRFEINARNFFGCSCSEEESIDFLIVNVILKFVMPLLWNRVEGELTSTSAANFTPYHETLWSETKGKSILVLATLLKNVVSHDSSPLRRTIVVARKSDIPRRAIWQTSFWATDWITL